MPAPKGSNNCGNYTRSRIEIRKKEIDYHLDKCRKDRLIFENLHHIAEYISKSVAASEFEKWKDQGGNGSHPRPLNKSTLYNNLEYRSKLDTYLGNQHVRGTANLPFVSDSTKIAELEIELSNSKNEVNALRRYIEKIDVNHQAPVAKQSLASVEILDFHKTAQIVSLLLDAMEGQLVLHDGCICNMAKRIDPVIAPKALTAPFLKWLKAQEKFNE